MNHLRRLLPLVLCLMLLGGCAARGAETPPIGTAEAAVTPQPTATTAEQTGGSGSYFDTAVTFTLYGADENLLDDLWTACARYERLLSKTVAGSDVDRINHAQGEPVQVDHETWLILQRARELSAASGGAFSVTIAPVSALWDFTGGTRRMPSEAELADALPLVDDSRITLLDGDLVSLPAGMMIDLGGIAKGYIADQTAQLIAGRALGGIINLGGNVYVVGQKPNAQPFRVGIRNPEPMVYDSRFIVTLWQGTVVTSGIYERYFEVDDVRYHHILDPKTGFSATSDLASATVVCSSSMTADAVATACIVLGSEEAMRLLTSLGLDGLLIRRDGTFVTTANFAEQYSLVER